MQAAKRSLDIATIQYQEGLVDFERVLDSQRTLFSQQERLVNTRGSVTQSLIRSTRRWAAAGRRAQPAGARRGHAQVMAERSDWNDLPTAPLPPPPRTTSRRKP